MNFFEHQEEARGRSQTLIIYFLLAVVAIVIAVNLAALGLFEYMLGPRHGIGILGGDPDYLRRTIIEYSTVGTLGLILLGAAWREYQLRDGGAGIARLLGAKPVLPESANLAERTLVNVVEEIAIAAGTSVPSVFVLENEFGINAFAAGLEPDDSAIIVTRPCIEKLGRDELQGVIAHEFSHICNGDMALNIRLISLLHGILVINLIGRGTLRGMGSGRKRGKGLSAPMPVVILAVALMLIGAIGVLFARLIKCAITRQREYLADASAVQFTRNPQAVAGALKKILRNGETSCVQNSSAESVSHMFFADAVGGWFKTHPPLVDRIKRIDPSFNELSVEAEPGVAAESRTHPPAASVMPFAGTFQGARGLSQTIGNPSAVHLDFAVRIRQTIPEKLMHLAHEPDGARSLVYALLLDPNLAVAEKQLAHLHSAETDLVWQRSKEIRTLIANLGGPYRLPLLELSIPALKRLRLSDRRAFLKVSTELVLLDKDVAPFEYVAQMILSRSLVPRNASFFTVRHANVNALSAETRLLLSAFAYSGSRADQAAAAAFGQGAAMLQQTGAAIHARAECTPHTIHRALGKLCFASPSVKQQVIEACVAVALADGMVVCEETELLRAACAVLGCPMPPVVDVAPKGFRSAS